MSNEAVEILELQGEVTISSFEIEQYRSLRAEILRGTEDGNQVMSYGLAAVGIVITAAMSEKASAFGFLLFAVLIPALSSLVLSLWFGTLERIARASFFITGIEQRLKLSLNAPSLPTWDTWLRSNPHQRSKKGQHFWTTEYSGFVLFIFLVIGPLAISLQTGGPYLSYRAKIVTAAGISCAEVGFFIWMVRRIIHWRWWLLSTFGSSSQS